jgi:HEAT repeat protein
MKGIEEEGPPTGESPRERVAHAVRVTSLGDVRAIVELLDSPDVVVREHVVGAVRQQEIRQAIPELMRRIGGEEPGVRAAMALALADFREPECRETLWTLVADDSEEVRRLALRGLSRLGDADVVAAASAMYKEGGLMARQEALDALALLGSAVSRSALEDLHPNHRNLWRRRAIRRAIRDHDRQAVGRSHGHS